MKKIRIQRVSACDVTVTLPLAVILGLLSVRGIGELSKMQTATEDYINARRWHASCKAVRTIW